MTPDALRLDMAHHIVDMEARRDKQGNVTIYDLPSNDSGGEYECCGLNDKYDPEILAVLVRLIDDGYPAKAEIEAVKYIAKQTDAVMDWSSNLGVEFYLRDTMFNRGLTGCAKILQHAIEVTADGVVGPITREVIKQSDKYPESFLKELRAAREWYEQEHVGYRANLWKGLVNRWDKAQEIAKSYIIQ